MHVYRSHLDLLLPNSERPMSLNHFLLVTPTTYILQEQSTASNPRHWHGCLHTVYVDLASFTFTYIFVPVHVVHHSFTPRVHLYEYQNSHMRFMSMASCPQGFLGSPFKIFFLYP